MNTGLLVDSKWEDYNVPEKVVNILQQIKFFKPSVTQDKFLKQMKEKPNASGMVEAPTGTGKTIAFLVKALMVVDPEVKETQVAILVHTQILCIQIKHELEKFTSQMGISHTICTGATSGIMFVPKSQIVIGTTESFSNRFLGKQNRGKVIAPECSSANMKLIIIDEADYHFKNPDFKDRMSIVISQLNKQVLLFSATLDKKVADEIQRLWLKNIKDQFKPVREEISLDNTTHYYINSSSEDDKIENLRQIYKLNVYDAGFKSIVFCRTKKQVDRIAEIITKEGYSTSRYHSDLDNEQKDKEFKNFVKGDTCVLITTDVLARGIDIVSIAIVINFEPPQDLNPAGQPIPAPDTYVHRIGRGGRFGRRSIAMTFVSGSAETEFMKVIQQYIEVKFNKIQVECIKNSELSTKIEDGLKGQVADREVEWNVDRTEVVKKDFGKKSDGKPKNDGETQPKETKVDQKDSIVEAKPEVKPEAKTAVPELDFDN